MVQLHSNPSSDSGPAFLPAQIAEAFYRARNTANSSGATMLAVPSPTPSSSMVLAFLLLVPLVVLLRSRISFARRAKGASLPPTPGAALPVIGHLHLMPSENAWFKLTKWSREIGPIIYLNLAGQPVVVLGNHKTTADLLDRRSGDIICVRLGLD